MRLSGKVAVITGGGRGIGKDTALLFSQEGAKVAICDFDAVIGEKTAKELTDAGYVCKFYHVNVSDRASVEKMVDSIREEFGKIDILVNNAGITSDALLTKMTDAQWDNVNNVNLKGVFLCTQAVVKVMLEKNSGVILNASSIAGTHGNGGQSNYVATKAGVIGLTKGWAKEFGRKGIRVNALAPGFISTDMTATVPEKIQEKVIANIAMGRAGSTRDVANAYLFLASDEASYITGQIICVDGGLGF